ncbi:Serine-protein kinase RsbW [Acidisarcina polymorpha]|uniref:Serine-protein kinase RsbW n=2 Tax=Acidisarcina polymorpha TaxID=2211140 RepID=A0A2Z5G640_9BACT|nr:ATP-binding protein [Acidisarcina polymorpha]AXC14558.1 Serine-protein kinase RsbW [Acidisarcina polymorpha]
MLCSVRGALGALAENLGLSPEQARAVVLAVDEALTNVIRHAYLGQLDRPISISFCRGQTQQNGSFQDLLEIVVLDRGVPLNEEKLRGRPLDEVRPGGLGLHFIRECMDKVEFRHDKGTNYLRMVKVLARAQTDQETGGEIECK